MDASFRSEENRERCSLTTDLGCSGRDASTAKKLRKAEDKKVKGTSQPSKTENLNTTPTAIELGDVVQAPPRPSAVIPMMEGDLGDLIARAVAAAMTRLDAH